MLNHSIESSLSRGCHQLSENRSSRTLPCEPIGQIKFYFFQPDFHDDSPARTQIRIYSPRDSIF